MPTYQYRCTVCAEPLEVFQSFSDDPLTECPDCGGELRKVFSSVGIVFKGSGFYRTDSRSGSDGAPKTAQRDDKPAAKAEKSESSTSSSSSGSDGGSKDSGSSSTPAKTSSDSGSKSSSTSSSSAA